MPTCKAVVTAQHDAARGRWMVTASLFANFRNRRGGLAAAQLRRVHREMKVEPEMLLKTKARAIKPDSRFAANGGNSGSCLLTPAFSYIRWSGISWEVVENK